jgi:hypothetical protein
MEFEAPSVWRIASKHTVTLHNLAALGPERLAAILVDLAEVDSETPTGTRRRLGQSLEKTVWLSGAELKVRIQLPPAESLRLDDRTDSAPGTIRATTYVLGVGLGLCLVRHRCCCSARIGHAREGSHGIEPCGGNTTLAGHRTRMAVGLADFDIGASRRFLDSYCGREKRVRYTSQ